MDPAWSQRNLGSMINRTQLPERTANLPQVMGAYKDLLLVCDPRQPTILVSGTSEPYGLTAGYVWPGDVDLRDRTDVNTIDTFFLWGKAGIWKWEPEAAHHIQQLDDYGSLIGHGYSLVRGVGETIFTDENGINEEQFGMILGLSRMPDYV
jgi:hypothetical protein